MIQPSLSFLALPIPAAMDVLGSFRTLEHLPQPLADGLIDMIEALMNCFPEATGEYYGRMDSLEEGFNHAAVAFKVLTPAVEKASYPLQTHSGSMDEDTPLAMALSEHQALELLFECQEGHGPSQTDDEVDALLAVTDRMVEADPWVAAEFDRLMNADPASFDYCGEAYRLLKEAKLRPEWPLQAAA